ncbi:MAG: hypothetical protein AABW71_02235 [Nanoarchaeota archaeon]
MKETYSFKTKDAARNRLRGFVQSKYSSKKRENLKVVTLLGHEDSELKQVWDPLGVRRENIVAVERDKDVVDLVDGKKLGVNLVYSPNGVLEYFLSNPGKFDVINLDYQGQFGLDERDALRAIAINQILGDSGVVATWFLGKREGGYTRNWFQHEHQKLTFEDGSSWEDNRSDLISRMIAAIFMDGTTTGEPHPLLKISYFKQAFDPNYSRLSQGDDSWNPLLVHQVLKQTLVDFVDKQRNPTKSLESIIRNVLSGSSDSSSSERISPQVVSALNLCANILFYQNIGAYFAADQLRMSYIGDNGSPMLVDVNLFEHFDFSGMPKISLKDGKPYLDNINNISKSERPRLEKRIDRFAKLKSRATGGSLAQRVFLGSSAKPVLTKQRAIEEFRGGATVDEVRAKYRGVNGKPLAAWKAHVTMGTYDSKHAGEDVVVEDPEDITAEKITKEEAIDFLSNGIPVDEIFDSYPTSFSKGQLRAFKAHIRMGTYKN